MKWLALILTSFPVVATAYAASFDCSQAQSAVERLICDNPELSRMDETLAATYKSALQDQAQATSIRRAQAQWLKQRDQCLDLACVKTAYTQRLRLLSNSGPPMGARGPSHEPIDPNVAEAVKQQHPASEILQWSKGALDSSSSTYYSIMITGESFGIRFILAKSDQGKVHLIDETKVIPNGKQIYETSIDRQSLFLTSFGSGGCCSWGGGSLQFKMLDGKMRLIGSEGLDQGEEDPGSGSGHYYQTGASVNLINGDAIAWKNSAKRSEPWPETTRKQTGNKRPEWRKMIFKLLPPITHVEKRKKLSIHKKWHLHDFDIEDYGRWEFNQDLLETHK